MAELDLIEISPSDILNLLKSEYYKQTGETLVIGSNEFASASAFAYVWSVLLGNINDSTKNIFLETATGEFLDAIAATYGIDSRFPGYRATASFDLTYLSSNITIPANAIVVSDSAGNRFTNPYAFQAVDFNPVVLYAVESGVKYNGIPANEITDIIEGGAFISAATNETMTSGGTDSTDGNDEAFREWLKIQIKSFAGAGTYQAYESRAKNADSRVKDIYVLRQNDSGYQKGVVQIFILAENDSAGQVGDIVQNACNDPSFRPIGDLVITSYAALQTVDLGVTFQVTYPQSYSGIASARNNRILAEYKSYLAEKIGRPFVFDEFCSWLVKKDDDGIYALDAKILEVDSDDFTTPIYPNPGSCLNPTNITISSVFTNRG